MSGRSALALPTLALSLIESGQIEDARGVYDEMRSRSRREPMPPTGMAIVAAALGENEAAIAFARDAYRLHDPHLPIFGRAWRQAEQLHALPEFQEILSALKLPILVAR
jgi:pentatricopeptide repeat protein